MRAHELIENVKRSSRRFHELVVSVKFDLGSMEVLHDLSELSRRDMVPPPFPICLFQVMIESDLHFFLTVQMGHKTEFHHFSKQSTDAFRWCESNLILEIDYADPDRIFRVFEKLTDDPLSQFPITTSRKAIDIDSIGDSELWNWVLGRMDWLARSFEVFSCTNVIYIDHAPPKFINSKRERKGKLPFFTYKTLHLNVPEDGVVSSGGRGTHSSPRMHLRRGHIRRLPDGRRIWVQACVVGSAQSGMVLKDYRIRAPHSATGEQK